MSKSKSKSFIRLELKGLPELDKVLKRIPDNLNRRVNKTALSFACSPMAKDASRLAPVRSGQLKKSIGKTTPKNIKNKPIIGVFIGARSGFKIDYEGKKINPRSYIHLVNAGTKNRIVQNFMGKQGWKMDVKRTKAYHFLQQAYSNNKDKTVERYIQKANFAIDKLRSKGKIK